MGRHKGVIDRRVPSYLNKCQNIASRNMLAKLRDVLKISIEQNYGFPLDGYEETNPRDDVSKRERLREEHKQVRGRACWMRAELGTDSSVFRRGKRAKRR